MKNTWNCLIYKAFLLFVPFLACTNVNFEQPVPQKGDALRGFPADWTGTYVSDIKDEEGKSEFEQIFRTCYRFERLSDRKLLVLSETRLHENDLPRLRKALDGEKKTGKLLEYQISGGFIRCTVKLDEPEPAGATEQQFTPLIKKGPWYILAQTVTPFRLFDLEAGTQQEFEQQEDGKLKAAWLPGSDSLTVKQFRLVARQLRNGYYFNTQEEPDAKWALLYVTQPAKDQLLVKISNLEDSQDFERRQDYFNAITPFRKTDDNKYVINPTDPALGQLLAEKHLFQTTVLRKIE